MNESGIKLEIDLIKYLREHPENKDDPNRQTGIDLAVAALEKFHVQGLHLIFGDNLLEPASRSEITHSLTDSSEVDLSKLAVRVRLSRQKFGWSQRELATRAGVSRGYIHLIEHDGLIAPSLRHLNRVVGAIEKAKTNIV